MLCNDGLHVFDFDEAELVNSARCFSSFVSCPKKKNTTPLIFLNFLFYLYTNLIDLNQETELSLIL